MKTWKILHEPKKQEAKIDAQKVIEVLLKNRNIEKEKDEFLKPHISNLTLESVGIPKKNFQIFEKRIAKALLNNEKIVIYGDYDVDGICATAILWETLYSKAKNASPFIPDRSDEGYGLSKKGIDNLLVKYPETKIIITVDNGIVAHDAVEYANKKGIDVVITDHHVTEEKLPASYCILHTTLLCGAGIAWLISKELNFEPKKTINEKLSLACLATIADLVPLTGSNRAIVKEGLALLQKTKRLGLQALLKQASVEPQTLSPYTIGHIVAPRLNATGRIQDAMNALRILCTKDAQKANDLAAMLSEINSKRQEMTEESVTHAKLLAVEEVSTRITIVQSAGYNPGVVGLIASRLVESYYKPTFAISIGEEISKGSARSIAGVNIIELLRSVGKTLVEAGGHPMAAGFSVRTDRLEDFSKALTKASEKVVLDEHLNGVLKIDMTLPIDIITVKFIDEIGILEPFGMGNPQPVFCTRGVEVVELRKIGREQKHLKLKVRQNAKVLDAVAFNQADKVDVTLGDTVDIAYTMDVNEWSGKITPQLKIKDIRVS